MVKKSDEENQILSNVPVPVIKIVFHELGSEQARLTGPTSQPRPVSHHQLWQHHFKFPLKTRHIRATSECLIKSTYIFISVRFSPDVSHTEGEHEHKYLETH